MAPAYPFGFGLSYGTFAYSDLAVKGRAVSFTVERTFGYGCDTPQLYVSYPGAAADPAKPNKVLRYFEKTCEVKTAVSYTLTDRDVSQWDITLKKWVVTKGTFGVYVAQASQGGASLSGVVTI